MSINIVILAAGKSSRFDGIKQLAPINDTYMLNFNITQLQSASQDPIYVALGANIDKILNILPLDITPLITKNWHLGLGHTISDVMTKISHNCDHVLFSLVDQVLIPSNHYQKLLSVSQQWPNKIVATLSGNKLMAPAIFPNKYFNDLKNLTGDKGAATLLKRYSNEVVSIVCEQAQFDIDTQENYLVIKQQLKLAVKNNQPEQV